MTEQLRRPVASYKTYREAARAVDHLSGHGFPRGEGPGVLLGGLETTGRGPTRT
ncbi:MULTISPECIES: hypothetical protein [Streptomyces]|uniref:hypothetical protein n=1 Tax=Streptomyces TaxID=1883 RepID=UPI000AC60780|nr:hypothetical protein [Streptomyces virginiae]